MADYPAHLARQRRLTDGRTVLIRPIRPDDEPGARARIDYERHMAFVCEFEGELVGDARYVAIPDGRSCALGIVVADAWRHSGIAQLLVDALIRAAQARGFETMEGLVLRDNRAMLDAVKELGFETAPAHEDPATVRVVRKL